MHDGDLGSLLAVFAHPDDEAYLAGGLMAVATDAGRSVTCVTATKGELGFPDDDPRSLDERAAVRAAELQACLAELGVTDHRWLGYPDGACAAVPAAEPVARLRQLIDEVRPDTVLTFGPDGQTFHTDHIAVSRWTTLAVRAADHPCRLLYGVMTHEWLERFSAVVPMEDVMMTDDAPVTYSTDELSVWFVCDDATAARKVRALQRQESQIAAMVEMAGVHTFIEMNRDEMFRDPAPDDWPA